MRQNSTTQHCTALHNLDPSPLAQSRGEVGGRRQAALDSKVMEKPHGRLPPLVLHFSRTLLCGHYNSNMILLGRIKSLI